MGIRFMSELETIFSNLLKKSIGLGLRAWKRWLGFLERSRARSTATPERTGRRSAKIFCASVFLTDLNLNGLKNRNASLAIATVFLRKIKTGLSSEPNFCLEKAIRKSFRKSQTI